MQHEHTHGGDPTYIAFVKLECRHPDCRAAFNAYRQRLAERKRMGEYLDMRLMENRVRAAQDEFAERLQSDPVLAGQIISMLSGVATEPAADEREVQPEPRSVAGTPVAQEPAQPRPLTVLGCLAELADSDGAIPMFSVSSHMKDICAKLGLEPLQYSAEVIKLHEAGTLKHGVKMRNGRAETVYRIGDAA